MKYIDVKNELIESCKSVGNLNFEEIDYCFCELKHCSKTNLLFCDIDKKTIKKAKKILTKHIKTKKLAISSMTFIRCFPRAAYFSFPAVSAGM